MKYYKLLDINNIDTVVCCKDRQQYKYVAGYRWVESGILTRYFCDESPYYNFYEEIKEDEVRGLIGDGFESISA